MVCMTETRALGQTLKSVRELHGTSLKTVAEGAEISPAYLQKLEKGAVTAPSPHVLHRLAGALGVEYLELMRLAGYVVSEKTGSSSGALAQALSAQDLTDDEARALATFLKMYRTGQIG
jgi:transcriptional regulator with XRE-family HTH domain